MGAALEVHSRGSLPQQWAATQNDLGNALRDLGSRLGGAAGARPIEEVIQCYDNALTVYTKAHFPYPHGGTSRNRKIAVEALEELRNAAQTDSSAGDE